MTQTPSEKIVQRTIDVDRELNRGSEIPESLDSARRIALKYIRDYQDNRIVWYRKCKLKDFLYKDVVMLAARGVRTATAYLEEAFDARESSSEETVMGNAWQAILAAISDNTLDTGDLTTERDGVLWVLELKAQPNTVNSTSLPGELRELKARVQDLEGRRRASRQPVKAALCVVRDTKSVDEIRTFDAPLGRTANLDLNGFEYRYITGQAFWQWLSGIDSETALLLPLEGILAADEVLAERDAALSRMSSELLDALRKNGLENRIDDVVRLRALI